MSDRILTVAFAALLGAWLGVAAITAFVVAPAAFEALPTRSAAGTFVGGILRVVYAGGLVAGIGGAVIALRRGGRRRALRALLSGAVAAASAASFGIAAKIAALRESLGPMDAVPADDPGRRAFGALHGVSIIVLFVAMLAALGALVLETATRPETRA